MARLTFFLGKGGVGKTTIAAAFAAHEAAARPAKRRILLSTDPAHSLAEIFQVKLGKAPRRVGKLDLWQNDPQSQFRKFLAPHRGPLLRLIEQGTMFARKEIEPLLVTALPGMAEVTSLLAIDDLMQSGQYDDIIVDTAPIGHTLRLLELPEQFRKFLDFLDLAAGRDAWLAQRFGGGRPLTTPLLEDWHEIAQRIGDTIASERARFVFVTTPEMFSLRQMQRSLERIELPLASIVLNRTVDGIPECKRCGREAQRTTAARKFLRAAHSDVPVLEARQMEAPVLGARALAEFGSAVFGKKRHRAQRPINQIVPKPRLQKAEWPALSTQLTITCGKGGVGKTTVSAGLAFHSRQHSPVPVIVCSTDPAPSLDEVFQQDVTGEPRQVLGDPKLKAVEFDSFAEYSQWANRMRTRLDSAFSSESRGVRVELSFDRKVLAALLDIVPPGIDEIFAIFKLLDLAQGRERLVIDMAPTGHALELLRMPERMANWCRLLLKSLAPHRTLPFAQEMAVEIATLGQQVRKLRALMVDARRCRAVIVTIAEPMPVTQSRYLRTRLERLGIRSSRLFVNRVPLDDGACNRCLRRQDAAFALLAGLPGAKKQTIYVVPEAAAEIAGKGALKKFTSRLWRLQ